MNAAWAQAVPAANAPAGQRAIMDAAANGVPIAHIAPPTAGGVSRNQYGQFNVGTNGLILNNSAGNVQTQLGGWIAGNPQLGVVPARVIVNEVTSSNASSLRGTMEVAGARANVIVANPNGITCDGCGFLNTAGRASLSTGTPQYGADGRVSGFNVTQGSLNIGAGGLNAANVEQLDLIARGLVVEGAVWAKNLRVLAGANQALYDAVQATPQGGVGAPPVFAVDIKNLGGMYADQVFLVATEKGLGVNSTGRVAALQGSLILSAAGDLTLKDSYAKGDLQLSSGGTMALTGLSQTDAVARIQATGAFSNSGTVDAAGQVSINAASVANSGAINARASGAGALTMQSAGVASNSGSLYSAGDLNVAATQLQGNGGALQSGGSLSINAQAVTLAGTQIISAQHLNLVATAGDVVTSNTSINAQGKITVAASGQASNTGGTWQAGQGVAISAAALTNTAGSILAGGQLSVITPGQINNSGSQLLGGLGVTLDAGSLVNTASGGQQAQIASDQAVAINLTNGSGASPTLNNQGGLISAKTGLDINANGGTVNNVGGILVANNGLTVNAAGLDNTNGVLSAKNDLAVSASVLVNAGGTMVGDRSVSLSTASGSLGGTVASAGDIGLTINGNYNNTSTLTAQGNLTISASNITNSGILHANNTLTANANGAAASGAGNITNSGEMSGLNTVLNANGAITNTSTGLIDGTNTTLNAQTVNNTGRIYGDSLKITAPAVNNDGTGVIAARGNLAIATQNLTNTGGALIYALGNVAIGGAMDAADNVTGSAASVLNRASTIEAGRDLSLSASSINNLNGGYTTRIVEVDRKLVRQYQGDGGGPIFTDYDFFAYGNVAPCNPTGANAYSYMRNGWNPYACGTSAIIGYNKLNPAAWGTRAYIDPVTDTTVSTADYQRWGVAAPASATATALATAVDAVNAAITAHNLDIENDYAMAGCCHYYDFQYTQVKSETQLATTNPGKLLSGGNMTLQGTTVNDASTIAAGGSLVIVGPAVANRGIAGVRETVGTDGSIRYVARSNPGGWSAYGVAPVVETIDVPAFTYLTGTNQTAGHNAGRTTTAANTLTAASMAVAGGVILTTLPNLRVPNNSLFVLHTQPGASYLVETDPRFTNHKAFLGSDYMLQQLNRDPERNLKRYGDGFFEQQQINDQILALTGRRFLPNYSNTEDEYLALMNGGLAFAKAYQLTPGVALTAAQMALLTTDIVWLTTQTATLPDGSTQEVLVPQVYLRRTQNGDLKQSGALIAGADVYIKTTGDLTNSGQIEGASSNILVSGNDILNTGTLRGGVVIASAARDLQNLGGSILGLGQDSTVSLMAGRDIVLRTTTQSTAVDYAGGRSSQTNIDRVATVQGGSVSLQAARDITAVGAQVSATGDAAQGSGQLSVNAQGDIRISGVQSSQQEALTLGGGNLSSGSIRHESSANTASNFTSTGDQQIAAGGALAIKGSNLVADGSISLSGTSVTIEAAKDSKLSDVTAVQGDGTRSRGMEADETLSGGVVGAGKNLTIVANGRNAGEGSILATGANLSAGGQATLVARNDVTLQNATTEHSSLSESHSEHSGFLSSSSSTQNSSGRSTLVQGASLIGEQVLVSAGNDVNVIGSSVNAQKDVQLVAGRDVNIANAQASSSQSAFAEEKKSGFSGSLMSGISYGKSAQDQNQSSQSTTVVGSSVSGANVGINSGRDTTITASTILADQDVNIAAGRNISVLAATETTTAESAAHSSSSSIGITPGLSGRFTAFGKTSAEQDGNGITQTAVTSLISANGGSLKMTAGTDGQYKGSGQGNITTQGADLLAQDRVSLSGNAVDLQAAGSSSASQFHAESKSVTLGSQLAGVVGSQISRIGALAEQSSNTSNSRLANASALKAGYDAYKLSGVNGNQLDQINANADKTAIANGGQAGQGDPSGSAFAVSVTLGTSKNSQDSRESSTQQRGTSIQASNIDITSRDGDISMTGAKLQANDIVLDAAKNLNLLAAQNTAQLQSHNSASSAGVGVTFGLGEQNGISFQLGANNAKGRANGSETTYDNTQVTATNNLTLKSGNDTNLIGAQAAGNTVKMDVGGQLNIQSLQDTSYYESKQTTGGFGLSLCIPPFCYGTPVTGNVNASKQQVDHNYQSTTGQSGIAAGTGGFDIKVAGATDLKGAAITSEADKSKNTLSTSALTYSDLNNQQNTSASSSSISVGYGGGSMVSTLANSVTSNLLGNALDNSGLPETGSQSSVTQSVISQAQVTITGGDKQSEENVATLTSRDASTANGSLKNTLTLQQAQELESTLRKAKENAIAAQYIGSVMDNVIGDMGVKYGWKEGGNEKTALHGLAGLIQAKVAGTNALSGAAVGALNEMLLPELAQYLVDQGYVKGSAEFNSLITAGSTLAGAAIGALTGGAAGAGAGASIAFTGTTNNFLKHDQAAAMNAALNACKAKSKGCTDEESKAIFTQYKALSDKNIAQVQACIFIGDPACVTNATKDAASVGEVQNTALDPAQQNMFTQRERNALGGSVTGGDGVSSGDLQSARQVADFRLKNCGGLSVGQCDQRVSQAMLTGQLVSLGSVGVALGVGAAVGSITAAGSTLAAGIRTCAADPALCVTQTAIVSAEFLADNALGGASLAAGMGGAGKVAKTVEQAIAEAAPASKAGALLNLMHVEGPASITVRPALSNAFIRNDGKLGEQLATDLTQDITGLSFKPIQNGSGNGVDLLGVDVANKTIWAPEVKSSTVGSFPDPQSLDLLKRTENWIFEAATIETIAGKKLTAEDIAYAKKIQQLIDVEGFTLKPMVIQVSIPKAGTTGNAMAVIIPIK